MALVEAAWRCDVAALQQLLRHGANPNKAHRGETALLPAARLGAADCVRALLRAGANPLWARSDGTTALHAACWGGGGDAPQNSHANYLKCIRMLLRAGPTLVRVAFEGPLPCTRPSLRCALRSSQCCWQRAALTPT